MAKTSSNRGSITSVAAIAVLGVGIFLGSKMKSPGPGGDDSQAGIQTNAASTTPVTEPLEDPPEQPPEPPLATVGPPEMIAVLIKGESYEVARPEIEGSAAMSLAEIAELAESTTGTSEGIRIRVQRHTSATAVGQQNLYQTLTEAGVKPEQMQQISEFVE